MNIDFSFNFKHFASLPDKGGNTTVLEILRLKSLHFPVIIQNLKDSVTLACFSAFTMASSFSMPYFKILSRWPLVCVRTMGINMLDLGGPSQWALYCFFFDTAYSQARTTLKYFGVFKDTSVSRWKSLHSVVIFSQNRTYKTADDQTSRFKKWLHQFVAVWWATQPAKEKQGNFQCPRFQS